MRNRAFGFMLGAMAMIVVGACTSTEKNVEPTDGRTLSDARNDGSIETNPSARESKPQAVAPQAGAKQPSPSPAPRVERKKQEESPPSSTKNGVHDGADTSDQREARITPFDQSEAPTDIETTRRIRQAVMQDDSLSFRAKNVTIVTNGDRVVLTGRVNTRAEADHIKDIARSISPQRIEDRLEIRE